MTHAIDWVSQCCNSGPRADQRQWHGAAIDDLDAALIIWAAATRIRSPSHIVRGESRVSPVRRTLVALQDVEDITAALYGFADDFPADRGAEMCAETAREAAQKAAREADRAEAHPHLVNPHGKAMVGPRSPL